MTSKTIYTSEKALPYVYRLDNPITGEFYIGYRKANKIPSHLDFPIYKTSAPKVTNTFDLFEWKILAEFPNGNDAYDHEQLSIFEEWDNPLLLNKSCYHNKGKFNRNDIEVSNETRNKMSESAKNRPPLSDDSRKKMSDASTGRSHPQSKETRLKISLSKMGGTQTEESNRKRSESSLGISKTETHKENMKTPKSQSHKDNISKSVMGLTTVFDFIELKCVKIHKDVYQELKGIRYVALNSFAYKEFKKSL